ncbi:MAG: mercury resistance system transport protein MerF [Candidatus Lambdaproteobacteria bacterium]|nr:mercury resistance system transport protein MerF [Candidatus Lambdaproteobacteria bacterium]
MNDDQSGTSQEQPRQRWLLRLGIVGTIVTALCCFTPLLVILLGVVGLSAIAGHLDLVLFPVLGGFLLLTIYAVWARRRHEC